MKRIYFLCLFFLSLTTYAVQGQDISVGDKGEISGLAYMDYYWVAHHHNPNLENKNGLWFRRLYFTYEHTFNETFSSRLRLEMNSAGDFQSSQKMTPIVKDAYLKWQNDSHAITAGISGVPALGLVEDVWGYRSVEKSPLDLYDFTSSRDFGLSVKGKIDNAEKFSYHFFLGNGNSNRPEIDKGKKVMLSLGYNITDQLVIEGYGDYNDATNGRDHYTAQIFSGYQSEKFNLGALYAYQHRESLASTSASDLDLVSVFSNYMFSDRIKIYLRADHLFDSFEGGSNNSYIPFAEGVESTFVVGGVDLLLADQVHLMPNVESIFYGETSAGFTPYSDIIPRLTLFYEF